MKTQGDADSHVELNDEQVLILRTLAFAGAIGFPHLHTDAVAELSPYASAFAEKLYELRKRGAVAHKSEPHIQGCAECGCSAVGCECSKP